MNKSQKSVLSRIAKRQAAGEESGIDYSEIPVVGLFAGADPQGACQIWGRNHAAALSGVARRSQKSSKRPLSLQHRSAMMLLAPETVQCMPDRLRRVPMTTLHPDSSTPVEVHRPCA